MSEKNKSKEGICAICGEHKKLSFEHVPPRSAFNDKPIHLLDSEQMFQENYKYTHESLSQKGLGQYTLCEACNNNTGSWYGDSFKDFAQQGMTILQKDNSSVLVQGIYLFKPLNVFKQIITMFLSADKVGYLRTEYKLGNFVLNKQANEFPNGLKIYIYSNASPFKRFFGHTVVYDPKLGVQKWAEINFQPFGYFLTEHSVPPNPYMVDITSWHLHLFDALAKVNMSTAYLKITSPVIGQYAGVD